MCPRPLQPTDLRNVKKPTVPARQCTACQHGEYVPQPGDVPKPLQGLKPRVLEALRPLEMDIGNVERVPHGYRVHSAMMAFAWKPKGVATAVEDLPKKKDRKAGRAALEFLLGTTDSGYNDILQQHEQFLDKHGLNADVKARKRPLRFIETEGLECALWPHLYWHRNLCETVARASHEARRGARDLPRRIADSDCSGEEIAEAEDQEEQEQKSANIIVGEQGRIKRGFLRKVLSPVIGYGADYNLLHFVYDLSMWTTIGTKKNLAARSGVALRHLLKGSPWTPEYWRVKHQAVLDMQRQCGNASLFRTRAPYERTLLDVFMAFCDLHGGFQVGPDVGCLILGRVAQVHSAGLWVPFRRLCLDWKLGVFTTNRQTRGPLSSKVPPCLCPSSSGCRPLDASGSS